MRVALPQHPTEREGLLARVREPARVRELERAPDHFPVQEQGQER